MFDSFQVCRACAFHISGVEPATDSTVLEGIEELEANGTELVLDDQEPDLFSWGPCECCGSTVGGARYTVVAVF